MSRSGRAGLVFPVGRIHRLLRKGNFAERIGGGAPVYLAAVMEYLVAEVRRGSLWDCTSRAVLLTILNDSDSINASDSDSD